MNIFFRLEFASYVHWTLNDKQFSKLSSTFTDFKSVSLRSSSDVLSDFLESITGCSYNVHLHSWQVFHFHIFQTHFSSVIIIIIIVENSALSSPTLLIMQFYSD